MSVLRSQSISAMASTLSNLSPSNKHQDYQMQHGHLVARDYLLATRAFVIGLPVALALLFLLLLATLIYLLVKRSRGDHAGSSTGILAPEMHQRVMQDPYASNSATTATPRETVWMIQDFKVHSANPYHRYRRGLWEWKDEDPSVAACQNYL